MFSRPPDAFAVDAIKQQRSVRSRGRVTSLCVPKEKSPRERAPRASRPAHIPVLRVRVRRRDFSTAHPCTDEKRCASCASPYGSIRRRPPLRRGPGPQRAPARQKRSANRSCSSRRKASRAPQENVGARPDVSEGHGWPEFGPAHVFRGAQGTDAVSSRRRVSGAMVFGYFLPKQKVARAFARGSVAFSS